METTNKIKVLWLDDVRDPVLHYPLSSETHTIAWVLSYEQFVQWIEKNGLPNVISFDHDLGDYDESTDHQEKTGMDCAKWLVNYCLDNNQDLPEFSVHSANPVGADNIRQYLNNFKNRNKI